MKLASTFIIGVFFVSVATFVSLNKRPLCIDSKIVEKIDRVSIDGTFSVWRCSLNRSVPYDEKFQQYLPEISRHLSTMERFFDEAGGLSHKVEIVWLDGMNEKIRLQESRIFISQKLLFSTDQLERGILRLWLREKSGEATIDRTLLEGALVDLIMFSLGHRPDFDTKTSQWPSLLTSETGLCQKLASEVSELHADRYLMCSSLKSVSADAQSILVGSSRPLISEAMISAYMSLDTKNRNQLIKSFLSLLSGLNRFSVSTLLSEESSLIHSEILRADIEKIQILISEFSEKDSLAQDSWKLFNHEFQNQMSLHGFSSNEFVARLDYLIQFGPDVSLNETTMESFRKLRGLNLLIGITDEQYLFMLPAATPLQKKIFGLLKAHQLMYLSCEVPSSEKLLEFSKTAEQLLFVHYCGQVADVNFREYFTKGYMGFAQSNPQLAFVQIHLPSLMQAWKGHSGNPLPALAKQDWKNSFFEKVGWQKPTWDESAKIFRTRSVIQAIEAYRPLPN